MLNNGVEKFSITTSENSYLNGFEDLIELNFIKDLYLVLPKFNYNSLFKFNQLIKLALVEDSKNPIDFIELSNLKFLDFTFRKKIYNINALANLKSLGISKFNETDLSIFSDLNNLIDFSLTRTKIMNLNGLNVKKLKRFQIVYGSNLSDLSLLKEAKSLETIYIDNCKKLDNVDFLSKLDNLVELDLRDCGEIESIQPLRKLKKLKNLNFYGKTIITDGNLNGFENLSLNFINKKHYTHMKKDFREGKYLISYDWDI